MCILLKIVEANDITKPDLQVRTVNVKTSGVQTRQNNPSFLMLSEDRLHSNQ